MMFLNEIIAVSKRPGLFKVVGMLKGGIIAESLEDGKRIPLMGDEKIITVLFRSSISLREGGKLPLGKLFEMITAHGSLPEADADDDELQAYFRTVCPKHDEDAFLPSYMRKVIRWYRQLNDKTGAEPTT